MFQEEMTISCKIINWAVLNKKTLCGKLSVSQGGLGKGEVEPYIGVEVVLSISKFGLSIIPKIDPIHSIKVHSINVPRKRVLLMYLYDVCGGEDSCLRI